MNLAKHLDRASVQIVGGDIGFDCRGNLIANAAPLTDTVANVGAAKFDLRDRDDVFCEVCGLVA